MCGIIGVFSPELPIDINNIKKGLLSLSHRGSDGSNIWVNKNHSLALGHSRLSIVDLKTGSQPIANEDKQIYIAVNGEFYDFEKIRSSLEALGHKFSTSTDSEILLHLYEEYGINCLKHLRGEFAFVLCDTKTNTIFAARDRFGIKPICYTIYKESLYIASEAKALFAIGLEANWDYFSYFHSSSLQYLPLDKTLFNGISQIPPGHYLLANNDTYGKLKIIKYWDMDFPKEPTKLSDNKFDEIALTDKLKYLLEESVKTRLRADVPICCYLSGGLDSSAIVALASQHSNKPLECYSVSFSEESYNELAIAQEMAQFSGANFNPVFISQSDLINNLSDAVYFSEGLAINGHLSAKFILSKTIHNAGFKVVLTGEGSDEILAGYPHLRQDLFLAENKNSKTEVDKLYSTNAWLSGIQLAHGESLPLDSIKTSLGFIPSFLQAKGTFGHRMKNILSDAFKEQFANYDCYKIFLDGIDIAEQLKGRHIVNQSSYLWSKLSLVSYILHTLGDGTEMANSIEGRLPFLDHKLFEFVRSLPINLKIKGKTEKYILREAIKPLITKTIYLREKHPFTAPPISCFSNKETNNFIQDIFHSQDFAKIPFFNPKKVINLVKNFSTLQQTDRLAMDPVLFTLLTTFFLQKHFKL